MQRRRTTALALALAASVALAGCAAGDGGQQADDGALVMWTLEGNADRITKQQALLDRFAEETGTEVELVPVAEDQLSTALTAAAASNELPDLVAALPLANVMQFASDDIIDTDATAAIIDELGADTFNQNVLGLTEVDGHQLAVPSDAFPLLMYYRTDLFEAAGLDAPTDFGRIQAAAEKLGGDGVAGIVAATTANEQFTSQTIENFALANGCNLVDDAGEIALDSPECVEAFTFYTDLMREHSTGAEQDTNTTRATYFAGQSAMVVWSSFLLDELAALRDDALPTCDECGDDPLWLAEHTGVVGAVQGPDSDQPAGYGEVVSFTVMRDAHPGTSDLVTWLMSDGYVDWVGIAPEGKVPTRVGTAENPTEYRDAWAELETGVDTRATLSSIYGDDVLDVVAGSQDALVRWGMNEGQGPLAGALTAQRVLPTAFAGVISSGGSVADAIDQAIAQAEEIKAGLGG